MAQVLILYYSRSGHTAKMADLVAEGVRQSGAGVTVKSVDKANVDELPGYDGVIMGSPTYFGTMAAELKKFLDDSIKYHGKLAGKVGGAFATCGVAGGGSETTVLDMLNALLVHGMIVQGSAAGPHYGPVCVGAPDERAGKECEKLGRRVANLVVRLR